MAAKVISLINEKGGVGKSQITFSLAWELSRRGSKTLIIDMDGQRANITYMCGAAKDNSMVTMYSILQMQEEPEKGIKKVKENLDIIPANNSVSDISQKSSMTRMKAVIEQLKQHYDYIFIDVGPSPDWKQFLTFITSDYTILIMLLDMMSVEANNGMLETYKDSKNINTSLKVLGILFNKFENRTNMSKEVQRITEKYAQAMETSTFNSTVRNAVSMAESAYMHIGITEYDEGAAIASDIKKLTDEIIERIDADGKER